jgi:hypothetical protein
MRCATPPETLVGSSQTKLMPLPLSVVVRLSDDRRVKLAPLLVLLNRPLFREPR